MKLYKSIDVWRKKDSNTLIRYSCFEVIPGKQFCVQSADFFNLPLSEDRVKNLEKNFFELLCEQEPDIRGGTYPSLEEAISRHDQEFQGEWS